MGIRGKSERKAILEDTASRVVRCTLCRLHEGRKQAIPGEGSVDASVLFVGEAPGKEEDSTGRPFVGSAGKVLRRLLTSAGLSPDDVFITNVVKCRPPGNRGPKADEVEACRSYLLTQIEAVRPKVLVTLGATALRAVLGPGPELKSARSNVLRFGETPVLSTYHPAAVLYNRKLERELRQDLRRVSRMLRPSKPRVRSTPPRAGKGSVTVISSGGVVVNPEGRILLLKRTDEDIWCLPKGTVERGESLEATAEREILEETGFRAKLLRPLMTIHYKYYWPPRDVNYDKTVAYFLAEPVGGRLRLEGGFDAFRWVRRAEAHRLLHWKNDRDVVARAFEILKASEA